MTDRIEPALSAAQWREVQRNEVPLRQQMWQACDEISIWPDGERVESPTDAGMIALYNAALPDADPRKITRDLIADLNEALSWAMVALSDRAVTQHDADRIIRAQNLVDALESYLPPATP